MVREVTLVSFAFMRAFCFPLSYAVDLGSFLRGQGIVVVDYHIAALLGVRESGQVGRWLAGLGSERRRGNSATRAVADSGGGGEH